MDVHLIDGGGLFFRALYTTQSMVRSDGMEVGGLRGFSEMLWNITRKFQGSHMMVVLDGGRSGRNAIYPAYKAHRPEKPKDVLDQLRLIPEVCQAFNVASVAIPPANGRDGYEADDLIASLATRVAREHGYVTIHSVDKDFYQLMEPFIRVYDPGKRDFMGLEACQAKFGVDPHHVADVQALQGDSVDNIPGVDKIGEKTAGLLIDAYGSLGALLRWAQTDTPCKVKLNKVQRENLREQQQAARISLQLATLMRNLDTTAVAFDHFQRQPIDDAKLDAFLDRMEFRGLAEIIAEAA
jgi:DNA polymerase-1